MDQTIGTFFNGGCRLLGERSSRYFRLSGSGFFNLSRGGCLAERMIRVVLAAGDRRCGSISAVSSGDGEDGEEEEG